MINDDEIGEKKKSKTKKKYNCSKFRESIKYRPKQNKDSTKVKAFLKLFKTIKKSYFIFNKRLEQTWTFSWQLKIMYRNQKELTVLVKSLFLFYV